MIVVDTQAVIWMTQEPKRLSQEARRLLTNERKERNLQISDITLLEIAMIVNRGRVKVSVPLEEYLAFIESTFTVRPITARIAARSQRFTSAYPKDPADRLHRRDGDHPRCKTCNERSKNPRVRRSELYLVSAVTT